MNDYPPSLEVVVLAAGRGKRMYSNLPKVLHQLAGKPLLQYIVETVYQLKPETIFVVYGNGGSQVPNTLPDLPVTWVKQKEILGTGHAVAQAIPHIKKETSRVLIVLGDTPLVNLETLTELITQTGENQIGLITVKTEQPFGLGRILRNIQENVVQIVEEKEATPEQKKIKEINSGVFCVPAALLKRWLPEIKQNNAQGEYYLTDIVAMAVRDEIPVVTVTSNNPGEMQGINDRVQLAQLERHYQQQQAEALMLQGLTLRDPQRFDLRGELTIGKDVVIDVNVIVEGKNTIGENSYIGPNTVLKNVEIGANVTIKGNCFIEEAIITDQCTVGPFARIRPGTRLEANVHVGNFVEIKNSHIQSNTKINHLSYVGDATIGQHVNIGAGTITCNYDGQNKHRTTIEEGVFVGSNTALVAPIHVGKNAVIGAGSTLSKCVPAEQLTVSRAKARSLANWKRSTRKADTSGENT